MNTNEDVVAGLGQIDDAMRSLLQRQTPPYDAAWNIGRTALSPPSASPNLMRPLWLMWGALTTWVENRPEESARARSLMRQAAKE